MGRQTRTPHSGEVAKFVSPNVVTSSSALVAIPNYGVTDMSTWAAGEYVLAAPDEGVRKTLFSVSSSSTVYPTIRLSTGTSVKIGNQLATQIAFPATVDTVVVLLGVNSTRWLLESASPPIAANSTGIVIGTS